MWAIDDRLRELDARRENSQEVRREEALRRELVEFIGLMRSGSRRVVDLKSCTPDDVRKFLVWKDRFGRSQIHEIKCIYLGRKGVFGCSCPVRLASGTVSVLISRILNMFEKFGLGRVWDSVIRMGNPADAQSVREYLRLVQEEQARAHVVPKQAKPIFLTKVKAISLYIQRELVAGVLLKERYVLLRDQAWFKLQFFAGDRAGDLANVVSQEIKWLRDSSGLVFNHTFGKTLRGAKQKSNMFVVKKCQDVSVCPVEGLQQYLAGCRTLGVDLSCGYLFRVVSEDSRVLDQPVSYSVIYERLKTYLRVLDIDEGETPHSFRAGCAVSLAMSGSVKNVGQIMKHIGWFAEGSAEYYSRLPALVESDFVAEKLASSVGEAGLIERKFEDKMNYERLERVVQ